MTEFTLILSEAEYLAVSGLINKTCTDLSAKLAELRLAAADGDLPPIKVQKFATMNILESLLRTVQVKLREAD